MLAGAGHSQPANRGQRFRYLTSQDWRCNRLHDFVSSRVPVLSPQLLGAAPPAEPPGASDTSAPTAARCGVGSSYGDDQVGRSSRSGRTETPPKYSQQGRPRGLDHVSPPPQSEADAPLTRGASMRTHKCLWFHGRWTHRWTMMLSAVGDAPTRIERQLTMLLRLGQRVHLMASHAEIDLDRSAYASLCRLEDEGPQGLGALATAFELHPSTISGQVHSLEAAGLAERSLAPPAPSSPAVTSPPSPASCSSRKRRNRWSDPTCGNAARHIDAPATPCPSD